MKPIIVDFNTMWGQPFAANGETLSAGWQITSDLRELDTAAAVVFHIPSLQRLPPRKPIGQQWVAWSMEAEANYPILRAPEFMRHFDLTMTYRLDSSVPIPYHSYYGTPAMFREALRAPPKPKLPDRLALLCISSPYNQSRRFELAQALMQHLPVHSYGRQLNNRSLDNDQGRASKLALASTYRFTLAFENAIDHDYVTEKFFDPLVAGSIPVYLGAPTAERFAPGERCFINALDFATPKALAEELLAIAADENLEASYHAWRERPFRETFEEWLRPQETGAAQRLIAKVIEALRANGTRL
jgi:Glycosyltransferase family 10 (fucosyltransferase) C-term/Fucosyltransferase, N-terminal